MDGSVRAASSALKKRSAKTTSSLREELRIAEDEAGELLLDALGHRQVEVREAGDAVRVWAATPTSVCMRATTSATDDGDDMNRPYGG